MKQNLEGTTISVLNHLDSTADDPTLLYLTLALRPKTTIENLTLLGKQTSLHVHHNRCTSSGSNTDMDVWNLWAWQLLNKPFHLFLRPSANLYHCCCCPRLIEIWTCVREPMPSLSHETPTSPSLQLDLQSLCHSECQPQKDKRDHLLTTTKGHAPLTIKLSNKRIIKNASCTLAMKVL